MSGLPITASLKSFFNSISVRFLAFKYLSATCLVSVASPFSINDPNPLGLSFSFFCKASIELLTFSNGTPNTLSLSLFSISFSSKLNSSLKLELPSISDILFSISESLLLLKLSSVVGSVFGAIGSVVDVIGSVVTSFATTCSLGVFTTSSFTTSPSSNGPFSNAFSVIATSLSLASISLTTFAASAFSLILAVGDCITSIAACLFCRSTSVTSSTFGAVSPSAISCLLAFTSEVSKSSLNCFKISSAVFC